MTPRRALVVCPGRGSYSREILGGAPQSPSPAIDAFDAVRSAAGRPTIRELDSRPAFSSRFHIAGEHASSLTAALSLADLEQMDTQRLQTVAVCGNSMGWYTALGQAGALSLTDCAHLVETMGAYQIDNVIGGQLLYPICDDDWRPHPVRSALVAKAIDNIEGLYCSIRLGGQMVLGGSEAALKAAVAALPKIQGGRISFPLRLPLHSAFHTPWMAQTAAVAQRDLAGLGWSSPRVPLIDGTGRVWRAGWADPAGIAAYTLGAQVSDPFDFTKMIRTALGEFAPDVIVLPGPGSNLGGAIAQVMVRLGWQGIRSRADFLTRQQEAPILLAMGRADQRPLVVR